MRRIILHAGFHKTGTTSLQQTLRVNRRRLRPDIRLVLRPGMVPLCEATRAYSVQRDDLHLGLVKYEAALLAEALAQETASTILISSEDLGGHMPGRRGLRTYGAVPKLMQALVVAFEAALPNDELIFFFTTRAPDAWLRSCYTQHLKASRLPLDRDDYVGRFRASANLTQVVRDIAAAVPRHKVMSAALEDHAQRPLGPAEALLDVAGMPDSRRAALKYLPPANAAPEEDIQERLLELNRSSLSQGALRDAKRALLRGAD